MPSRFDLLYSPGTEQEIARLSQMGTLYQNPDNTWNIEPNEDPMSKLSALIEPTATASPITAHYGEDTVGANKSIAESDYEVAAKEHEAKANALLRKAMEANQSPLAGLGGPASLIPAALGALGGAIVGTPKLSPYMQTGVRELQGAMTGWGSGLAQGAEAGQTLSDQYVKDMQQMRALNQRTMEQMAENEQRLGAQAEQRGWQEQYAKERDEAEIKQKLKEIALGARPSPAAIDNRTNLARENLEQRKTEEQRRTSQLEFSGRKYLQDTARPTAGEAAELRRQGSSLAYYNYLMSESLKRPDVLTGADSAIQEGLFGLLQNAGRNLIAYAGANFTQPEIQMVRAMIPKLEAGDLIGSIRAAALGRDQKTFAETMQQIVNKSYDNMLADNYGNFATNKPLSYYPKGILDKYGLSAETNSGIAAEPEQTSSQYNNIEELDAAYKAGKITRDEYINLGRGL